jgi:hypothetical protein
MEVDRLKPPWIFTANIEPDLKEFIIHANGEDEWRDSELEVSRIISVDKPFEDGVSAIDFFLVGKFGESFETVSSYNFFISCKGALAARSTFEHSKSFNSSSLRTQRIVARSFDSPSPSTKFQPKSGKQEIHSKSTSSQSSASNLNSISSRMDSIDLSSDDTGTAT